MEDIVDPGFWHSIQRKGEFKEASNLTSWGKSEVVLALHADYLKGYHMSEADKVEILGCLSRATWTSADLALEQLCCQSS